MVVVRHQHVAGGRQVRRPVLRLPVRAHHAVVAADAEVVLRRHAAGEVQRLLAGEHHRRVGRHDQDALGVHEHRGLGVPVRLRAHVDAGDHDVDLAAVLGELDDPLERRGHPVHVLGARVHRDPGAGRQREPLQRHIAAVRPGRAPAITRRHSGSDTAPSALVGSPSSTTRVTPSGWRSVGVFTTPATIAAVLRPFGRSTGTSAPVVVEVVLDEASPEQGGQLVRVGRVAAAGARSTFCR